MNLAKALKEIGVEISSLIKVYHGYDHDCRCGCAGRYFEAGTRGFKLALKRVSSESFKPLEKGAQTFCHQSRGWAKSHGVESGPNWLNIPYDGDKDRCYTFYFPEK